MIMSNILPKSMAIDNNRMSIEVVMTRHRTQQNKGEYMIMSNILPKSMATGTPLFGRAKRCTASPNVTCSVETRMEHTSEEKSSEEPSMG